MNIDFHAHLLPEADHGCKDASVCSKQLSLAKDAGIDLVVATPHFYPQIDNLAGFLSRRSACAQKLAEITAKNPLPKVLLGAEVQLCRGLDRMEGLEQLCIEGTKTLLLELPPNYSVRTYEQTLDALLYGKGLTIVLAHIDRYASTHVDFLLDAGCLGQLNAGSLCHLRQRRRCLNWAQNEAVVALGSDIHGLNTGYTEFLKAKKLLGSNYEPLMQRTQALLK